MKRLFAVVAITALLLPVILDHVDAQSGKYERSVTLKVTDTKTGAVHTKVWDLSAYTYEKKIPIDVPQFKVKKIKQIFVTDTFGFTLQNKVFEGEWLHFKVEMIGIPLAGKGLSVRFT